ncbi:MAG: lipase family protein, partial [Gammaproteobacteria bacterium]|nr:lipase family protein [Gammaproteobacteria bacterium]
PVMKIIEQRAKGKKVWLTGHSLGGAVAFITAFEIERRQKNSVGGVYTYGAPPVGNAAWAVQYNKRVPNTHRWSLQNDPVALVMVQLPGPFKHVGQRHNLTKKGIDLNEKREMRYPLRAGMRRLVSDLSTTHMGYWCRLQSETNILGAPTPLNSECDLCSI